LAARPEHRLLAAGAGALAVLLLGALLVALLAPPAAAASLEWEGILRVVIENPGGGIYAAAVEDETTFWGVYVYGDTCSGSCIVQSEPPYEIYYTFPDGFGSITGLGITTFGADSSVKIGNDHPLDADGAALITLLGYAVSEGEIIDYWAVGSETSDNVLDWEVTFGYVSTNPFATNAYTPTPPASPDLVILEIEEDDAVTYLAFGNVTWVPEPSSHALLGAGVGVLVLLRRVSRRG
jgi:hypothetical protein